MTRLSLWTRLALVALLGIRVLHCHVLLMLLHLSLLICLLLLLLQL